MRARQLPARQGVLWLIAGLQLLRRNPPLLTLLTFGYFLLVILINLVPVMGPFLLPLALPALTTMVANGCRALELGRPLDKMALFYGLADNRIGLLRLGALQLLGSLAILSLSVLIEGGRQDLAGLDAADPAEMLGMLARLLMIAAPVLLAFWFAPLLTAWDGVPAAKALFFSMVASLRNWRAFAAYVTACALIGIVLPGLVLVIAGAISPEALKVMSMAMRMLLIFIMAPVMMASVYLSYRDVFHGFEADA